jgi:hypothetical protein
VLRPLRNEGSLSNTDNHVRLLVFQGRLAMDEGRHGEAEAHFAEAERLRKAAGGDKLPYYWMDRASRGSAMARQGRLREAEALQRDSLQVVARLAGEGSWAWRWVTRELAATLRLAGNGAEADALERQVREAGKPAPSQKP